VSNGAVLIVKFNVGHASYVGNDEDGCYYQTAETDEGWFVTVVVDCGSAAFTADYLVDEGPFDTEQEAELAGEAAGQEWCINNEVDWDDGDSPDHTDIKR